MPSTTASVTPVELERLQGLPDVSTGVAHGGRQATDRPRLRVIANTFPVPMVRWVGEGILVVERVVGCGWRVAVARKRSGPGLRRSSRP